MTAFWNVNIMKIKSKFLKIYFLFSSIGCSENQNLNNLDYNPVFKLDSIGLTSLPTGNTIGFFTNSISYYKDTKSLEGIISIYNPNTNSIVQFREDNPNFFSQINLEIDGPNGIGNPGLSGSHLYHSNDSIFIYNNSSGILHLINNNGDLINKFLVTDYDNSNNFPAPFPSVLRPIQIFKNSIIMTCGINNYPKKYSNYPSLVSINLSTKKINYLSTFPKIYDKAFWGAAFKYDPGIAINKKKNKIVFSYPINQNLIESDMDFEKYKEIYGGSYYFEEPKPYNLDPSSYKEIGRGIDYKVLEAESLARSDFAGILFDQFNNFYYRIAYIRPTIEEVKSGKTAANFSIIIFDQNLKKIGEDYFSSKKYDNTMIFVTSKGLNIARKDLYNENEDLLQFEILTPVLINTPK